MRDQAYEDPPGASSASAKLPGLWSYRARVLRVVDGDTVDVRLDLGLRCYRDERLRLLGVDTPEMNSKFESERRAAKEAKLFVEDWCFRVGEKSGDALLWPLIVTTQKADSFGRWLASIRRISDGGDLAWALLDNGLAEKWKKK